MAGAARRRQLPHHPTRRSGGRPVHGLRAGEDPYVGEWQLRVQLAAWRLEDAEQVLVACEDPSPVTAEKIVVLRGCRITAVTVTPPAMETVFHFDGVRLLLFPVDSGPGPVPGGQLYLGEGASCPTEAAAQRPAAAAYSVV
jgi:hypothetical protein